MPSWSEKVRRVSLTFWHWINMLLIYCHGKVLWWHLVFLSTDTTELWGKISHSFENNAPKQVY